MRLFLSAKAGGFGLGRTVLLTACLALTTAGFGQTQISANQPTDSSSSAAQPAAVPDAPAPPAAPDSAAPSEDEKVKPIPVFTGFGAFVPIWQGGSATLVTIVTPVLLVPIGDHWLVESRGSFEDDFHRPAGGGPFGGPVQKTLDYLQLDYIANPYVTVSAGRYLTPFGMFNERFYPNWIRPLQTDPLILPIEQSSSDGAMLRGGFPVSSSANLSYAAYFSANSNENQYFAANRSVGGRLGIFFTGPRLEVGGSFLHLLQDDHNTLGGFHAEWQPRPLPLTLRTEYAYSENGKGYWLEGGYMLSQLHFWQKPMSHTQVVARMQNFYLSRTGSAGATAAGLPDSDTARFEFGVNYFLMDGLKALASYGRTFSRVDGNSNIWTVGMTYRFVFPLGPAR